MLKTILSSCLAMALAAGLANSAEEMDLMVAVMTQAETGDARELRHQPIDRASCVKLHENLERARKQGLSVRLTFSNPDYTGIVRALYCIRPDGSLYGDDPPESK